MTARVNRWGSSYGVRFSKSFLQSFNIGDKTKLDVTTDGDKIILTKSPVQDKSVSIADYFKDYPKDQFYQQEEIYWGKPVGDEIW